MNWEKILANRVSDKGLMQKIFKELKTHKATQLESIENVSKQMFS